MLRFLAFAVVSYEKPPNNIFLVSIILMEYIVLTLYLFI